MTRRILIASHNAKKARELETVFKEGDESIFVVPVYDVDASYPEPEESGSTFLENARIKARAAFEYFHEAVIADDSGLEVASLSGEPGVHSARYSKDHDDEANNKKLLRRLEGYQKASERAAQFVSVIVYIDQAGKEYVAQGICQGTIAFEPAGSGGFGYDPLFIPDEIPSKTFAEVSEAEKNAISHRGRALADLKRQLAHGKRED
ncbi:MAG: RdgB/HAM1 family non-canonical purine NTP pyrophosphatase [Coriobacteriia bacterium]|nr:RdgB/HAM1 family non-canonical purine NTP pyrophosphatase [Coriobacteriia bacterium]